MWQWHRETALNTDGIITAIEHTQDIRNAVQFGFVIIAALCNRAGHYIFVLWFLLSFFLPSFLFFFPRLISAVADWMSTILSHMMWP